MERSLFDQTNPAPREDHPDAAAILRAAGWAPHPEYGVFTRGTLVMGLTPDGQSFHVKDWARIMPGHPLYGPDTPDTAEEAAAWLVARYPPNQLSTEATLETPAVHPAPADDAGGLGSTAVAPEAEAGESAAIAAELSEDVAAGGLVHPADPTEEPEPAVASHDPIDADYTDLFAAEGPDPLLELEAPEPEDFAPDDLPPQSGPIAYAASDLDALVREKLGRVSQIARELKAILQEGWTLEEFASLQNLIVRIDRQEAPDDAQARARFLAISERSQAMSRVDSIRDLKEGVLEGIGRSRDYAGAVEFDPEAGWPGELL